LERDGKFSRDWSGNGRRDFGTAFGEGLGALTDARKCKGLGIDGALLECEVHLMSIVFGQRFWFWLRSGI